jgi:hypothetical protein
MITFNGNSGGSGLVMRGPTTSDADFALSSTARVSSTGGSSSTHTTFDSVFLDAISATVLTEADVNAVEAVPGTFANGVTYTSLDPSIATVNANGQITRVSNGMARILVSTPLLKRIISAGVSLVPSASSTTFQNFVAGSLGRHAADAIDSRIAGKGAEAKFLYSSRDTAAGTYVLNASAWCAGVDTSMFSANGSSTLITPRHVYTAKHYVFGNPLHFVNQTTGEVVTRTIVSQADIGPHDSSSDGYVTDIKIARLNADVPAGIAIASILPSGSLVSKLKGMINGVPCLGFNQFRQAGIYELRSATTSGNGFMTFVRPPAAARAAFCPGVIDLDSGSPVFVIINGVAVLLTSWTFKGPSGGAGVDIRQQSTAINAAITTLGGGGSLSVVDLSSFTSF